jgi:hypothetical protein
MNFNEIVTHMESICKIAKEIDFVSPVRLSIPSGKNCRRRPASPEAAAHARRCAML